MKQPPTPIKSTFQSKPSTKPPIRGSNNNAPQPERDASPEPVTSAFRKSKKTRDVQNSSNSGLFGNTPSKRSPKQLNRSNLNASQGSITELLNTRRSTAHKRLFGICHVYTYQIPKIGDDSNYEVDQGSLGLLLNQKEEEIKELRDQLLERSITENCTSGYGSQPRPTEIDNTIFAFEEERAKVEIQRAEDRKEISNLEQQLAQSTENQNALNKRIVQLEERLETKSQVIVGLEDQVDAVAEKLEAAHKELQAANELSAQLFDAMKAYFEAAGAPLGIEPAPNSLTSRLELLIAIIEERHKESERLERENKGKGGYDYEAQSDDLHDENNSTTSNKHASDNKGRPTCKEFDKQWVTVQELDDAMIEIADLRLKLHKIVGYLSENTNFCLDGFNGSANVNREMGETFISKEPYNN